MEAREADLLLHVGDASSLTVEFDIESVARTLKRIGCEKHPQLMIFNKLDRVPDERRIDLQHLLTEQEDSFVRVLRQSLVQHGERAGRHLIGAPLVLVIEAWEELEPQLRP